MKISAVKQNISFGRNLTQSELEEYKGVLKEGKKVVGQSGKSIFIMPSACLPQSSGLNTGAGSLASEYSQDYLKYMQSYLGFNMVEDLPPGHVKPVNGFYCAYNGSAFALGNHQIAPELLATEEFGNILTKEEVEEIADCNRRVEKETYVNFHNIMDDYGAQNKALKKAFKRFKKLDEESPLRKKFEIYKKENAFWLDIPRENEPYSEFFKFKQFIADEHLQIARQKLNEQGIKLCGDCHVGFTKEETKAFPKAFKEGHFIGLPEWRLPALNFDEVTNESSDAFKVLKQKVQLFARRYDAIRFDVGWSYINPVISKADGTKAPEQNMGSSVLNLIEDWVKDVQGEKFDKKNLIYEVEASPDVFNAFNNDGSLIEPLRGRVKIYGSTYMHGDNGYGAWGYNQAYLDRDFDKEEFMLGVGNHDPQPLRQIAEDVSEKIKTQNGVIHENHKQPAIGVLSEILKIEPKRLIIPEEFAKAKWAEPMMAHNNFMFYMDVFGREDRFDMHGFNLSCCPDKNYAYKVPTDYKRAYHEAVQEGFGFNPMDALEKVFRAKGFDEKHPKLFEKIQKFNNILSSDGWIEEAAPAIETGKPENTMVAAIADNSKVSIPESKPANTTLDVVAQKTSEKVTSLVKKAEAGRSFGKLGIIGAGILAFGGAIAYFTKSDKVLSRNKNNIKNTSDNLLVAPKKNDISPNSVFNAFEKKVN